MLQSLLEQEFQQHHPLHNLAQYHLSSGGKCIRGQLALSQGEFLSLSHQKSLRWAIACELLHNATLIHDDIQDNDPIRRGQPSLWKKYGVASAINTGDLLIFRTFNITAQLKNPLLTELLAQTSEQLVHGQMDEIQVCQNQMKDQWQAYLEMARLKTGVLFLLPIKGIYILANQTIPPEEEEAWLNLGLCYQIYDDIKDFLGLKQKDQIQKDLEEQKINAITAFLSTNPENLNPLQSYLTSEPGSPKLQQSIQWINEKVRNEDSLNSLKEIAKSCLEKFTSQTNKKTQQIILHYFAQAISKERSQHVQNLEL